MSTEQHTPAPWFVAGSTVYALKHHSWKKGVEQFCNSMTFQGNSDNQKADVALISAAPELLAALKRLMGGTTTMQDAIQAAQQARAAIAKATGSAA